MTLSSKLIKSKLKLRLFIKIWQCLYLIVINSQERQNNVVFNQSINQSINQSELFISLSYSYVDVNLSYSVEVYVISNFTSEPQFC